MRRGRDHQSLAVGNSGVTTLSATPLTSAFTAPGLREMVVPSARPLLDDGRQAGCAESLDSVPRDAA